MRSVLCIGFVVMATTVTRVAIAAPPPSSSESSPAISDAARARFNEGIALYGKKKYERAHAAFLQAYGLTKNPAVLINLGLTSLKMGRPLQAARYFDQFQKEAKDATPDQRARAQKGVTDARRSLGTIEVTAPEGAEISVDGEPAGRAPLPSAIDVLPGRHEVTSTTTSGTKSETVTVGAASTVKVRLAAQRPSAPPSAVLEPDHGTAPGASSESPSGPAALPAGASQSGSLFAPPNTSWPVYAAGAVGLVSFTAAIVLSGIGANADSNVTNASDALMRNGKSPDTCFDPASAGDLTIASTCTTLRSGQRTSDDVKTPFVVTLAVGGGATLFALGWYFFAPKAHGATEVMGKLPVRIAPRVGPRGEPGASFDVQF
jgi:hypothetical protein